jgi:hypothetical protein
MSKAFCCDLCSGLEQGDPAQRITVKPVMGNSVDLEMCAACLVSFNDWRVSRAPEQDRPRDI